MQYTVKPHKLRNYWTKHTKFLPDVEGLSLLLTRQLPYEILYTILESQRDNLRPEGKFLRFGQKINWLSWQWP